MAFRTCQVAKEENLGPLVASKREAARISPKAPSWWRSLSQTDEEEAKEWRDAIERMRPE